MRRSLATWVLVAAAAALMCLPSGCIGSRLGRKSSGEAWSRPSLLGWGKKKSSNAPALAQTKPPASNVAPGTGSGLANSGSQSFPATNASGGYGQSGTPAAYASTGASAYGAGNAQGGNSAPSGQNSYVATSGGANPQRGFYPDEYQGGSQAGSRSQYSETGSGGYGGGYNDTASGGQGSGYQDSYGGASQSRGYEAVADQRGSYGSAASGGSGYGDQYQGSDSRYVTPAGGQEQYDSRSPAPAQYNDTYGSQYQGTSADSGYGSTGGGSQYSGGGYSDAASQGASGGAPVQSTTGARPWLPGSTKQYNQQPLNPPTNSGYSGQY